MFAASVFLIATVAYAAPTISITMPVPGQALYDMRPTIAVAYAAGDPDTALDLKSLVVLVNGSDWTGKFTKTAGEAVYAVSAEDALAAGTLTIEASISDDTGVSASATQQYEVFPTLQEANPSAGREGDEVTVTGLGLDPAPERNVLRFRSPFDVNGVDAPFTAVDRMNNQGVVKVPADAISGPVRLVANGKPSRETIAFVVPSLIPCRSRSGNLFVFASMSDGGWLLRGRYWGDPDPRCPPLPNPPNFIDGVMRIWPDGQGELLGWNYFLPNGDYLFRGAVVDGNSVALFNIARRPYASTIRMELERGGAVTQLGTVTLPVERGWASAAFDPKGNLYIAHHNAEARLVLSYVPKEELGGRSVVPTVVATDLDPVPPEPNPQGQLRPAGSFGGLHLSCDGFAYLPFNYGNRATPPAYNDYRIRKLALPSGAVVADVEVRNRYLAAVAQSCHTNELWGSGMPHPWATSPPNSDTEYWRATTGPAGISTPVRVELLPEAGGFGVVVGPEGDLYADYYNSPGLDVVRLRTRVEPCDQGGGVFDARSICACPPGLTRGPNQSCEVPLVILPTTTSWRPQKATTQDVDIYFEYRGEGKLTSATATITGPSPVAPITIPILPGAGNPYKITWSGPWTTDPGNPASHLARGPYTIVVTAVKEDGTTVASGPFDPNGIVSLVEVNGIRLEPIGGPGLDDNPGPCPSPGTDPNCTVPASGKRLFAEAENSNQGATVYDKVSVIATIDPPVADLRGQGPINAYFKPLDVDDPSAEGLPVDDPTKQQDNQGTPPTGFLTGPGGVEVGDGAIVEIPIWGTTASTTLRVSRRQGDNYRVASATSRDTVRDVVIVPGSTTGEVKHLTITDFVREGGTVTEMITVWRTLHLEVDALVSQDAVADQAAMDFRDPAFTFVAPSLLLDIAGSLYNSEHPALFGWFGANLSLAFHASDWYDVAWNNDHVAFARVRPGQAPLTNGLAPPAIFALQDKSYVLRDDEVSSLDPARRCGPSPCQADFSLATALLARAYVRVQEESQSAENRVIPFDVGVQRNIVSNLTWPAQVRTSPAYWSTQLLSAFEGAAGQDFDPRTEGHLNLGLTSGGWAGGATKLKSSVFLETIRDLYEKPPMGVGSPPVPLVLSPDVIKRVTAHEILHTFGIGHDTAIMCGDINVQANQVGGTVTMDHITQIRSVTEPVAPASNAPCP